MHSPLRHVSYRISLFVVVGLLLGPLPTQARMDEVSDDELGNISAQAGININFVDFRMRITIDSLKYSDTDHDPVNWVEFNDVTVSGPEDGHFLLDCPEEYPMMIDLITADDITGTSRTFVNLQISNQVNPRTWEVGEFKFCDQELGSLLLDSVTVDPSGYRIASHVGEGTQGIEFEYVTKWQAEGFSYTYNTIGDALQASGIHLAGTATGDPTDPTAWDFSGYFKIGDLMGGNIDVDDDPDNTEVTNPASFDVLTVDGTTYAVANLPLSGSLRVEDMSFGGSSFGPIAIDGITAHRLYVTFDPGM